MTLAFDEADVVTGTGLLAVRRLDRKLGVLAEAAARLPDPRSELTSVDSTEDWLTQTADQLRSGYFDAGDVHTLRNDAVLQSILNRAPGTETQSPGAPCGLKSFSQDECSLRA